MVGLHWPTQKNIRLAVGLAAALPNSRRRAIRNQIYNPTAAI